MHILQALLGLVTFVAIAYALSENRSKISWRVVVAGLLLQFVFALLILKTAFAPVFFGWMNDAFIQLYDFVGEGATFVFGDLVERYPFGFHVIPTVIFFSALVKLLYEIGIGHRVVYWVGLVMKKTLKTSGAESLAASANIFLGQTEAPLVVRPYVGTMTRSELFALMVPGMASVAGGVMAAYVGMLSDKFPNIAGHLFAASMMSAPAGLMFAKLMVPETGVPETSGEIALKHEKQCDGPFDAIAEGTKEGLYMAANIIGMLVVFIAGIAALNFFWSGGVSFSSGVFGVDLSAIDTLQEFVGFPFAVLAWLMGIPTHDLMPAGILLGEKTVLNEFIAYGHMADYLNGKSIASGVPVHELTDRTKVILSYALCGFSNFASIGILTGGIGAMAPNRRGEVARLGLKCMVAASLSCFTTAAIAAMLT